MFLANLKKKGMAVDGDFGFPDIFLSMGDCSTLQITDLSFLSCNLKFFSSSKRSKRLSKRK